MFKIQFKSLKTVLSATVVAIIAALTVILVVVSYNAASNSVDEAYINQLINFSKDIDGQISRFYEQQLGNAMFFSKNREVIDAIGTGNYEYVTIMFKEFADEHKIYENIFISTAENNPRIVSAIAGVGTRWGGIGYDDNIKKNLNGEAYISDPQKSPVTGLPVNLFSVPIKRGGAIIGIMAFAVNIGEFSNQVIKDIKVAKTGFPYIVTLDGITIAHPKKEFILNLDLKKFDWGKKVLKAENGEIIRYTFDGINKIIIPIKNEKYRFITGVTVGEKDITDEARSLAMIMVILSIIAIALTGGVVYFVIVSRLAPLDGCREIIKEMAEGNLSVRYNGKYNNDEIGEIVQSLNTAMDQFEKTISGIITASQNVAQAVEQIASGNQNLSQRTSEQASSLEEIASTIEEAAATVNQNAENATRASELTNAGADKSTESNKIANEAVKSIMEMNQSSKKVADIIAVINEIAFQTNLLALNAAVEAARAGEQGRGFAVVAGEVRNLAQRSGNAAKEIEELIKDTVNKVEKSTDLVNKTGIVLKEIEGAAKNTAQIINEIATASIEQKQGIDQINNAIAEMDNMTQQNASLVEETASASEEMSNQAQDLLEMVKQFNISDMLKRDVRGQNPHELHLRSLAGMKNNAARKKDGNGNGRTQKTIESSTAATHDEEKVKIKEIMKNDGFEEF
jgi:methyl-accepting chemotaxis protein